MSESIQQNRKLTLLGILSAAGFFLAAFLSHHFYELRNGLSGFDSFCNLGGKINCDVVSTSSFAEPIPGFPLSSFAAGFFLSIAPLTFFARNMYWRRDALRALLLATGFGTALSLFYLFIMIFKLEAYCTYCLGIDAINLISFGLVLSLAPELKDGPKPDRGKWKTFAAISAVSLLITLIGFKGFDQSKVDSDEAERIIHQVLSTPTVAIQSPTDSPSFGPDEAPITLIEFSDFQCPYCKMGAQTLHSVLQRYRKEVRVVFKNFPLDGACNRKVERSMHPYACTAAKAAMCAHQQGKFEAVYQKLFEQQELLSQGKMETLLTEAGTPLPSLQTCMDDPATLTRVQKDIEEGLTLNVESTPSFFINGHPVQGALTPTVWFKLIDRILASKKP